MPNNPQPKLVSLSPTQALVGTSFTLTVNGTGFMSSSVVKFNGHALVTTFISSIQLTALVPATLNTQAQAQHITVLNAAPGGGESQMLILVIYANLIKVITNNTNLQLVLNVPGDNIDNIVTVAANAVAFDLGSILSAVDLLNIQPTLNELVEHNTITVVATAQQQTYDIEASENAVSNTNPFIKAPVRLASIVPLPSNTYNNGTAGVGATLTSNASQALAVDGTPVVLGDRVLVAGEATAANNGIYTVTNPGINGSGYSISLPTDADYGVVSSNSFVNNYPNLSISFWLNTSATLTNANYRILGNASNADANGGWEIYLNVNPPIGTVVFNQWAPNATAQYNVSSSIAVNDGVWHNIVMTYSYPSGVLIYIDGRLDTGTTYSGTISANYTTPHNFDIGESSGLADALVTPPSEIALVQLWDTTLAASDAATLSSGGSVPSGLIARWTFSEQSGITAADNINGNTLYFSNINWSTSAPLALSSSGTPFVLTRTSDFNMWNEFPSSIILVTDGLAEANTEFFCPASMGGTIGTTALNFNPIVSVLPERLSQAQITSLSPTVEGLMVYNLTTHTLNVYNGTAWKAVTLS